VPYTFCAVAPLILHRRDPRYGWTTSMTALSVTAFGYTLFAIGGAGADVVFWGFLLLLSGIGVYAGINKR
jgi:hypothetical protein